MRMREWSTAAARRGQEASYWRDSLCAAVFELDVHISDEEPLAASVVQHSLGPISLSDIDISKAQLINRTRKAINRSTVNQIELVHMISGKATLDHVGCTSEITAGDCILVDSRQPYRLVTMGASRNLSIHIPVSWLALRMPRYEGVLGRCISRSSQWGQALEAVLHAAARQNTNSPGVNNACAEQIAGALFLAVAGEDDNVSRHRLKTYQRLVAALSELSTMHNLNANMLAQEFGISTRYLHSLFAAKRTTFRSELKKIRAERAAALLRDPRFDRLSVAEIGRRCGYDDPGNFSRAFQAQLGNTPGAYRQNI